MAEQITKIEREYVIPLRKAFIKAAQYERTGKAIKEIKKFIARHMKIPEKDVSKVKLDVFFNNDLWFRGRKHPPAKIKVKAVKENDIVKVTFAEIPHHVKFLKLKMERRNKKPEEKPIEKKEEKKEEKPLESKEEKKEDEEKKRDEKEKGLAVAEQRIMQTQQEAKVQKHLTAKKDPGFHRMALKK